MANCSGFRASSRSCEPPASAPLSTALEGTGRDTGRPAPGANEAHNARKRLGRCRRGRPPGLRGANYRAQTRADSIALIRLPQPGLRHTPRAPDQTGKEIPGKTEKSRQLILKSTSGHVQGGGKQAATARPLNHRPSSPPQRAAPQTCRVPAPLCRQRASAFPPQRPRLSPPTQPRRCWS